MGWQNTRQVEAMAMAHDARLKGLPLSARVTLDVMACNALDDTGTPVYFRGWTHLATQLGYWQYSPAAERAVARAIDTLIARGLVEQRGYQARRREYVLHLLPGNGPRSTPVDNYL